MLKKLSILCLGLGLSFIATTTVAVALEALPAKPPVPKDNPMSAAKVELGRQLYFDKRLSRSNTVSCNSCHNAMGSGTDNAQFSSGIDSQLGGRNAPTVWNSAYLSVQFWDGRAPSLEEQAKGPIVNPVEMGMESHDFVIKRLAKVEGYQKQFKKVFGGQSSLNIDNVAKAIAAYERTLITPDSPFDRFMKGNQNALSAAAKRGMQTVQTVGCTGCHSGPAFAGPALPEGQGFYMKFPTFADTDYDKQYEFTKDTGRYEVTKNVADKHMWRVAQWRNIELTSPYFHNGSVKTLDEAVRVMAKTQLNKDLKPNEVEDIVAFLKSLTGKRPKQTEPKLPPG